MAMSFAIDAAGKRQEAVAAVPAEHVETDDSQAVAIEEEVDRTAEQEPVQADRHREQLAARELLQNPSSPTSGTNRHATDRSTAGPSGLRTTTSSRWTPPWPTGMTRRPPGSSCS